MKDFADLLEEILQEMPEQMQDYKLGELAWGSSSDLNYVADFLKANGLIILPCKVGDTVFKIDYAPCHEGNAWPDSYTCEGCQGPCDIKKVVKEIKMNSVNDIWAAFCRNPNQKMYFLTKEEAEKNL